jgi:hypothetical protein
MLKTLRMCREIVGAVSRVAKRVERRRGRGEEFEVLESCAWTVD